MGLVLDTSVLIASERRGESVASVLEHLQRTHGEDEIIISAISIIEFTHGIYHAQTESQRRKRQEFVEEIYGDLQVQPLTFEIAQLAGRIEASRRPSAMFFPLRSGDWGHSAVSRL